MLRVKKISEIVDIIQPEISDVVGPKISAWQKILGMLRAHYLNYQNSHWLAAGNHGIHLLFERLYTSIIDQMDGTAEKMIGTIGFESLDRSKILGVTVEYLRKWEQINDPFERGLASEEDFLTTVGSFMQEIDFTEGEKNLVAELLDEHEENVYLLKKPNS